jgi:uncharacterized protein YceK
MKMKKTFLALVGIAILSGCYFDKEDKLYPKPSTSLCDTTSVTFTATVLPIMMQGCATSACHDATSQSGGYNLTTYTGVKVAVDDGKLVGCIRQQSGFDAMPKSAAKLDDCSINKVARWVNLGAKND